MRIQSFTEFVNEAKHRVVWRTESVKSNWFETGQGTAYYANDEFWGLVYKMGNGKWTTVWMSMPEGMDLGGLLRELRTGKMSDYGTSSVSDTQEEAEMEMTGKVLSAAA